MSDEKDVTTLDDNAKRWSAGAIVEDSCTVLVNANGALEALLLPDGTRVPNVRKIEIGRTVDDAQMCRVELYCRIAQVRRAE